MDGRNVAVDQQLYEYVVNHGTPLDEIEIDLIQETHRIAGSLAIMQIGADQARLLTLLTKLVNAQYAVEVGTFTGFSSLAIARGLASNGKLLCCDVSEEWTAVARRAWQKAGVAEKIELRLAPALETLGSLPREPHIDLSFLDALKNEYIDYWNEIVPRTRVGGLILADNVFQGGAVVNEEAGGNVQAIREFNAAVVSDPRVEQVMLPIGDGVTIARKVRD